MGAGAVRGARPAASGGDHAVRGRAASGQLPSASLLLAPDLWRPAGLRLQCRTATPAGRRAARHGAAHRQPGGPGVDRTRHLPDRRPVGQRTRRKGEGRYAEAGWES